MEITNDKLLGSFALKVPLRAFISGSRDLLTQGKPAIAVALDQYATGVVQVFETRCTEPHAFRVIFWHQNQQRLDFTLKSLLQLNDLTVSERPEIKLIKHVLKNDSEIAPAFKDAMKGPSFRRSIVIKMTSSIEAQRSNESLVLATALLLGTKVALGALSTDGTDPLFEEEAGNLG